ncbi:Histidine kinase [Kytococcus aerolatus]|uniref:histidine kinase n=1 Tax=Kytococcus aerolatus TaxID=592308 RepID=A0A212U7V1_9MICO|nr:Histidine kinase [Kytococcus aerolatus]
MLSGSGSVPGVSFLRRVDPRANERRAERRIAALTASRREVVDAYEVERRRIERDLHDGAQQYMVAAAMLLGEARELAAAQRDPGLSELLAAAQGRLAEGLDSLRATVRGIHPASLVEQGLAAALEEVAERLPGPIRVICPHPLPVIPEGVLVSAYFFACEAMANAAKHAPGAEVTVLLAADTDLRISVVDTGPGGARILPGHGLSGLAERLAAFGGEVTVASPPGGPTQVAASVPLLLRRGEPGVVL